eukprot:5419803-Lingulodinium_polyedra.AAC.1
MVVRNAAQTARAHRKARLIWRRARANAAVRPFPPGARSPQLSCFGRLGGLVHGGRPHTGKCAC